MKPWQVIVGGQIAASFETKREARLWVNVHKEVWGRYYLRLAGGK